MDNDTYADLEALWNKKHIELANIAKRLSTARLMADARHKAVMEELFECELDVKALARALDELRSRHGVKHYVGSVP